MYRRPKWPMRPREVRLICTRQRDRERCYLIHWHEKLLLNRNTFQQVTLSPKQTDVFPAHTMLQSFDADDSVHVSENRSLPSLNWNSNSKLLEITRQGKSMISGNN
eukprot:c14979_g1_i1 orf=400-717(-)